MSLIAEEPPGQTAKLAVASAALASIPAWWARRAGLVGLPRDWRHWALALPPPPAPLGEPHDGRLVAAGPHALGEAYVCTIAPQDRERHGRHYTPKALSSALWDELRRAKAASDGLTIDPASGAGALLLDPLRRAVRQAAGEDPGVALASIERRFTGIDNDPCAVWLGNAILGAELLPLWARMPVERRGRLPQLLRIGDGLDVEPGLAQTLVMNPPFGRVALSTQERDRWAGSLYGHANSFGLFLHAAVERVRPGGHIAAIVPASFLGGAYYQRLRALLAERAPLVRLAMVTDRSGVFASGVLQETCIAVFERGRERGRIALSTHTVNGRVRRQHVAHTKLVSDRAELPWLLPRAVEDRALIRRASALTRRLADYGWRASTGPLVWNRHRSQIAADRTDGAVRILWAADIDGRRVQPSPRRDAQRWYGLRECDGSMILREAAVLVQRTTAPEQPRRLVAAHLDRGTLASAWGGAAVVENHVNVLRCATSNSPLTPELLVALLNTSTVDRIYRCMSGTVAVSAYELAALPLPGEPVISEWAELSPAALEAAVVEFFA